MHLTEELENCKVKGLVSLYWGQQCQNQCRLNTDFEKDEDKAITHLSLVGTKLAIEAVTTSRSPQLN